MREELTVNSSQLPDRLPLSHSRGCQLTTENCQLRNRGRRGAALILAIFATVILAALAVGLANVARVEVIASRASLDRLQARYLAQAGFNLARAVLMYQDEPPTGSPLADSLQDEWANLSSKEPLQLGEGSCRVKVIDACSLININTAKAQMLSAIIGDDALVQAIIARREANGDFQSVGELLLAEGMTKEKLAEVAKFLTVESKERNIMADGKTTRTNINDQNASEQNLHRQMRSISPQEWQQILIARSLLPENKFRSLDEFLQLLQPTQVRDIIDKISLEGEYAEGRVNINTAPREVLTALPGSSPEVVEAVLERRAKENGAFTSVAELYGLSGLTDPAFVALAAVTCTKSSSFIIEAEGGLEGKPARQTLQGLVLRFPPEPDSTGQTGPTYTPIISGWRELPQPQFLEALSVQR